ncbi:MAG: hypothetical protein JNM24_03935 [Bdellovibrionaceae bacterium]|nr:hypothetical protein [Pseudobdellovibrionaceae bacterium]
MKPIDKLSIFLLNILIVISIVLISFLSYHTFAADVETIPFKEYKDEMRKEGQFFSVHLSVGSPIRIFVVGKEEAKIDLSKLELTVRRLNPYPGKVLKADRYDHYFIVNDPKSVARDAEFEITVKSKTSDEKFKFDLKNNVP